MSRMKGLLFFILTFNLWIVNGQTLSVAYQPTSLGTCLNVDTIVVNVTNSTLATLTNVKLVPSLNGFNYTGLVSTGGVTITNSNHANPEFTIASIAPGNTVKIKYFIQPGCFSTSTAISNVLRSSTNALLATINTSIINVVFPAVTLTGISNTSIANQTPAGFLQNLTTEKNVVRGFNLQSTNSVVGLTTIKVSVINSNKHYKLIGLNRGTYTQSSNNDTFTYTFRGSDFTAVGDGDTILEFGENFNFYDTMKVISCNTSLPSNLGLKYYATYSCFVPSNQFCAKSTDLNAIGEAKVVSYALTVLNFYSGNGFSNLLGSNNRFSFCKPFEVRTTYKNTSNGGGISGVGTLYDLDIFQSSTVWPFAATNALNGFTKNNDGTFQYEIDSIKINGVKVSLKDTFSNSSGTIFHPDTVNYGKVKKVIKLTPTTYTASTANGLKDLDGDGEVDDLAEGDTVQVQVFYRMNGRKYTSITNSENWELNENRPVFDYQQTHTSIYYRNMCKQNVLPRAQYNFLYNYQHFNSFEVGGVEDFYSSGAQHTMFVKFWNQFSLPYGFADTQKIIIKTILPPGLNYVPGSVGKMHTQTPTISQINNPGGHWLNAAQQVEIDGVGDYDTVLFVFNNSTSENNTLHTLPFKVTMDCATLSNPCADAYSAIPLVQDSIRSLFYLQWKSSGANCYDEFLMKDATPIRKHCPGSKKGFNIRDFQVKRQTIGFLPDYRRVKISSIHPFIDSIDYGQTIPYDTVKYTMRGYVQDTAYNSGLAYLHFKNLYDNLDTINLLSNSTIKIFDVSSGSNYTFLIRNANYVRPSTGNGDIVINLGAFVDSVRAAGNTNFMLGGSVGSSAYQPDSFILDLNGVLIHNTQKEPYLNTQRELNPLGELKSVSTQVNLDCDIWGRPLKVVQLYHGIPTIDYTPNASLVSACDLTGLHLFRWYYWQLPTPDYFPYETRFSNRLMDTMSFTYNPIYVDSIIGPYVNSFVSFNRNPAGLSNFIDSNYFTRNIGFAQTSLPQNQRLIERYTNRVVFRMDSIYPKFTPTFTSDDYHHFNIGLYFRPTCAMPLNIPYQSNNNTVGSFMPNLIRARGIYWHNRQMPRLFDSTLIAGGVIGTWNSYSAAASSPNHSLSVNPSSANIAQKDTVEWTVTIGNGSTTAMPLTWLDFRAKTTAVVRVLDLATNLDIPILTYSVGVNEHKWAKIGNLPANSSRQFKIFAKVNGCNNDTIALREGYNCANYPVNPELGYLTAPNNYSCNLRENFALLPIQVVQGHIQLDGHSLKPTSGNFNICDTIEVEYILSNLGDVNLSAINLIAEIPLFSTLNLIADSSMIRWPLAAPYQKLNVTPTVVSNSYHFNLSSKFKNGVLLNRNFAGDSSKAMFKMKFLTNCPFRTGAQILFKVEALQACGTIVKDLGFATNQLKVNGLPAAPTNTMLLLEQGVKGFNVCIDSGYVEFKIKHTSGSKSNRNQYIQIELPSTIQCDTNNVIIQNSNKLVDSIPQVYIKGSTRIAEWQMDSTLVFGDSIKIKMRILPDKKISCNKKEQIRISVFEKFSLTASCSAGGLCEVEMIQDFKFDTIELLGPSIELSNLVVNSVANPPFGETVNYSFNVKNYGRKTNNVVLRLLGGMGLADSLTTLPSFTLDSAITLTRAGSLSLPYGKVCSLKVLVDSLSCSCQSFTSIATPYGLKSILKDTLTCSGESIMIGRDSLNGYGYLWSNSSTNAKRLVKIYNTSTSLMLLDTNILTINRGGCSIYDTFIQRIHPMVTVNAGLDTSRYLCAGDSVQIGTTSLAGYTYSWSPTSGLNFSNIAQPIAKPVNSTTYFLTVTNTANGCRNYDTVTVNAISSNLVAFSRDYLRTCRGATNKNIGLGTPNLGGVAPFNYSWTPSILLNNTTIANPSLNPSAGGDYTYIFRVTDSKGCTASDTTKVIIDTLPPYAAGTDTSLCQGNQAFIGKISQSKINYTWNPSTYLNSSTISRPLFSGIVAGINPYILTVTDSSGECSLNDTIVVSVNPIKRDTLNQAICKGQVYNFRSTNLQTSGIYRDTLMTVKGCDSFIILNLLVKDTTSRTIFDTICSNQVRPFNGINRTTTGIYKDTLINAQGCDSFLYLNLFVKPTSSYTFNASICNNNPYSFNGQNLTTAGTYFDTLINSQGCDSFLTLNLSVSNTTSHTLNIAICKGQFYTFNGQNRTTMGTYLDTLTNAKNCDSFLTLNLTVKDTSTKMIYDTICKNQTRNFNNQTLNTTGIYKDTLTNSQGCDSFLYLNLHVKDTSSKQIFDTICSNQVRPFNGINRTTAGIYKDTLINAQGCDSFLYLNLFVKPTSSYTFNASICNNNPYNFNGQNLTTAGTYFDTLTNSQGCDSFLTLNLSVSNTTSHTLNIAICKGQFYTFNGQNRTTTGTYLDTLTNAKNCDSFLTLNLTVKDTSTRTIFDTICKNQTRSFNNQILNTTGIYKDTLINSQGCDSFLYLNLHVKDTSSKQIFDTICSNQVRPFNGINRTTTGIYKDTLINAQGCDSFLYLNLFVKPTSSYAFNASICNNNPYNFNGQNLTTAGTYFDTLTNSQGCDSFLTLNLSVSNTTSHTLNIAICKGQFYTFNGQNRTTTGTYLDTLTNAKNCDSFLTLNLTVKDTSTRTIFDTICKNQTRSFNNQILNTTGIYKDTLINSQGCDSFLYLNLHVKDTSSKQIFDTICSNQVRPFNGINRTTTGIYKDTLINAQGCDSFLYLNLFVKPTSSYTFNASICNNNPYSFNGQNLTTAGTYFDTLINSQGCDSFLTLNLSVSNTTSHTLNIAICKGQFYTFNGQNRTTMGTYLDTLTNAKNCDSFLTLNLTVKDTSTKMIYDTICKNQTRNFNNQTLNTTGIYKDTLTNSQGCDSFLYLNLHVKDTSSKQIFDTICSNQVRPFNGINRTTAGIYKDTLINAQGCDSFLYLNLFVKPTSSYTFNASICNNNPYNFNGQNLTTAGTYFDTLTNSQGCDSFLTLNLSVSNTTSHTLNIAICKGQFYTFNGQNRTTTGTYLDTLTNAKNCDSFLTLNLTVKDTSTRTIFDTICKNQTRSFNNQILNTTGIYKDTLINSQGCDSFLYLNLHVKDTSSKQIFDTICSNQVRPFNGINRTTTGIYKDTLINAQGCDSFLYLNLFVKPTSSYAFNASICNNNPYNFNGQNLTTAGTYFDTLTNSQGCDSFLTLNLSVSNTTSHTLNIAICKGQFYTFNGQNRTTTGTYLDTLTNAKNCDSFLTLNLTVKDTSTRTIFDTICKNQTRSFNNQILNTTGIYKDTLINSQGCDSFLYLNLHVKDTSSKQIFDTICSNQVRPFNGINRTTTGIYKDTLINAQGCDSFLYLNLFVKPTSSYAFNASICNNNPYNFNGQNLTTAGTYFDTLINSQGCDSFLTLNLSVSNTTSHTLNIAICEGQFYTFNGQNRTTTGTYLDTLTNAKNCDSFLTLNLTVKDTSTKMIYDTICKNQTKNFNNQTLTTTGIYKDTLINSQGCDSFLYLNLLVKDTTSKTIFDTICSNQVRPFNGINRTTTGIYKDTLINAQGCDSFLYLNLFVKPTSSYTFNASICNNNPYSFNGQNLTTAGTYFDTLINFQGCDSFLTLNLSVSNTTSHTLNIAICKGQFYTFNGQNRTTTGTYLDTLTNAKNCDSFLTLNLTVKDTSTKMIYDTICKNQTRNFNNQTLNTTGIYKDTLTNAKGCDSFLYLNLHVKDTSRKDSFRTICKNQPIIFNGNSLNTSGVYRDTFVNSQGCDSFLVLNLTVNDTTKKDSFRTICRYNPIVFNGQTLSTSGIYRDTLINSKGCDSFLYLHLTVNDTTRKDSFKTICKNQTIVFNGQNLNVSGLYKDTLVNMKGCDSFLYLHLIVNDTSHKDSFKTICKNQPILFNGQSLNVSGLYRDTLINSLGCDSFIYLYLSVNDTARKDSSVIICKNQPIVFNGQTLNTTGIYKDTFTNSQGCDSFLYLHLTVKDTSSYLFTKQICQGDSVIFNNIVRTLDGLYRDTAVNVAGCDSFIYLRLIVNPLPLANAGSDALRYNCKGDSVQLGTPSVTGIGYQWSPSGFLSSSIIAQPWAKPIVSTQYVLKVTNLSTTCFSHDTMKIDVQNIAITAQISKTNLTCFNNNSGRIKISPAGGIRPYLYWVEGKTTPQFDSTITGLNAGNEYYRIEDAKGCELRDTFSLTQPQQIEINLVAKKNLRCYQKNEGEIEVKVKGGTITSDYDYSWSGSSMKSKKVMNLSAGQHTVTITDNNGCTASFTETLIEPSNLLIQPKIIQNKCFGDSTASIELQVSQATSPYRYRWSNDSIRNINTRLKEGKYWATITDANLCEFVSDTYRIKDHDKLVIDSTVSTPSGCGLRQSGALVVFAKGGVRDYLYSIDSGNRYSRDSNFEALKPGVYQIVIRDKNACTARTIDSVKGSARLEMAFLPKDTSIKLGQELQVSSFIIEGQARWINDIQWSPTEGLSCTDCLAPQISTFVSQRYKVRIRYFKDCYIEEYIKVRVISDDEIYIPNSFSPNATVSDENKTIKVYGKNITVARMRIFNRWGEKVYETEDAQFEGWDGTYKGEPQPAGVYVYYLELEFLDRRKITKTSEVNLIR